MSEFNIRREKLLNMMKENSVTILFSGVSKIVSEDELFPFTSNRHFFYLTGIEQENSILMLVKGIGETKTYLFVDEYDEVKEKWTGKRLTFEEAKTISDVENVFPYSAFKNMVYLALTDKNNQYGNINLLYVDLTPEIKIKDSYSTINYADDAKKAFPHIEVENIYPYVRDLRMVKSEEEINNIREAIKNTNSGVLNLLRKLKSGIKEHELADEFEFFGRLHGRQHLSFSTIVASGKNATCLHYPSQNDVVRPNDLVLFDLGYAYKGYSADISRTFPENGVYSGKAKDVYTAVVNCNKAVINHIEAGMTIKDLQDFTRDFLKKECVRLGLLKEDEDITRCYYHNVSHHLGLDTHDTSLRERPLQNGNVITVEPGLYFADLGVGVRVEDDVAIINGRGVCLSDEIVKEIDDIERLMRSKGK